MHLSTSKTLIFRNQTLVSETEFCFFALPRDFEDDPRAFPLAFVLREIEIILQHEPDDCFVWHEFGYSHFASVVILVAVYELSAGIERFLMLTAPKRSLVQKL